MYNIIMRMIVYTKKLYALYVQYALLVLYLSFVTKWRIFCKRFNQSSMRNTCMSNIFISKTTKCVDTLCII